MRSSLFWDVTQRRLVVTDVWRQIMGPIVKGQTLKEDCLTLENGTHTFPETSVTIHQSTLCNIPEERRSHSRLGKSLKSSTVHKDHKKNRCVYFTKYSHAQHHRATQLSEYHCGVVRDCIL
jgi:hypothetical protein